jgi:uncharacterized delta-60 repeat protein
MKKINKILLIVFLMVLGVGIYFVGKSLFVSKSLAETILSENIYQGSDASVYIYAIQPDGKIIIGGNFSQYNGVSRNRIARLNSDGSLDTSFNPGTGLTNVIRSICIQPDGKIIIGGDFTTYNGVSRNRIARLNSDGSLDTSFNPGTGADQFIRFLTIGLDSKIIIVGDFTKYNGTPRNRIARLNSDGSLDTSFNPGTGADYAIFSIYRQPDNKLIINGYFSQYNGVSRNRIARLNSDGSLDTSFDPNIGADDAIFFSSTDMGGRIVIVGNFTMYNGQMRNYIARINSDASLDNSFNKQNLSFWTRGSWIRVENSSSVYFLDTKNVRHAYINEAIWYSYFDSSYFYNVRTISKNKLESYPLGKNVPFNANSLVKVPNSPKVYRVSATGVLQWIKTENTATRLYGPNWNKMIHDLSEASFKDYKIGFSIE